MEILQTYQIQIYMYKFYPRYVHYNIVYVHILYKIHVIYSLVDILCNLKWRHYLMFTFYISTNYNKYFNILKNVNVIY